MQNIAFIKEELKKVPQTPGVYLMHDESGEIIYVGKAVNLKRRVSSYFRTNNKHTSKISSMVSHVSWFEYILTDSELEALILENNLIKENRPRYNTMLRDDKTYPYVCVTTSEEFPRILIARKIKKDGNRYFGPFTSSAAVRDTIELLLRMYKVRNCSRKITEGSDSMSDEDVPKLNGRPCLYYHIGQCDGPCIGRITKDDYKKCVDGAIGFLEGDYRKTIEELTEKMNEASSKMEFEDAMEYRDLINSINHVAGNQKVTSGKMEDQDVIACAHDGNDAVVQVFFMRDGKIIGREHYYIKVAPGDGNSEIVTEFIKQYYSGTPFLPHELLVSEDVIEPELVSDMLSRNTSFTIKISKPLKGKKERLIALAKRNADNLLATNKEKYQREIRRTVGAVKEIEEIIGISDIHRMESYDISNISGYESVASMVVYEDGRPKRNAYRKFKIKTVIGPDDYASMREVLTRRFTHGLKEREKIDIDNGSYKLGSFSDFPDLILMDGGRGQVNIALEVLNELGINIPVCGMVKDDNHRTRGLYFNNTLLPIDTHSECFNLITRIQDETHRFAITFHRDRRGKAQVHSILDDIPGIGPARRRALMKAFTDITKIQDASVEELSKIPGMNKKAAESVAKFFLERKNG